MKDLYKKFNYFYQKDKITSLLKKSLAQGLYVIKFPWVIIQPEVVLCNLDIMPMNDILERTLSKNDFGLSTMICPTQFHTNPKNNGLIIFPLTNNLKFQFSNNTQIIIDGPTLINGRMKHRYFPVNDVAMFYAIKIPLEISWKEICSKIKK